jgi:hypothetical protein
MQEGFENKIEIYGALFNGTTTIKILSVTHPY